METWASQHSGPSATQDSGTPRLVWLLASAVETIVQQNERVILLARGSRKKDEVTIFHGSKSPTLTIRQYLERVFKYAKCSTSCFVVAYIYLERYLQRRRGNRLTLLNVHRLLITSILVAAKFMDDECYSNGYYAKVGGVSTAELNKMELEFLFHLDFRLNVTVECYRSYCCRLEREKSGRRYYKIEQPFHP
ncbi:unnamed protein product [Linum tenue]|uniref:Cyclin n=2 Tax=Linum tenue TaxID=586396 RepID=A0AAV0R4F2_9ROSI|nr:unnamed protein product [Linum tenue]